MNRAAKRLVMVWLKRSKEEGDQVDSFSFLFFPRGRGVIINRPIGVQGGGEGIVRFGEWNFM